MERPEFEASDTKLEHEMCGHCEESRSASRVLTSCQRLANQLKIDEIGEVGKLEKKIDGCSWVIQKLANWEKLENW